MAEVTYLEAIKQGMREEMQRDERVYILGEDVGAYGGAFKVTAGLLDEFGPMRVIDTPLSESAIVGAAVGSALMGQRPIAEMQFMDFIACGFDQIVNMAAKMHYRQPHGRADGDPRSIGRRRARRPVSLAEPGSVVRPHAGPESRCAVQSGRCLRPDQVGDTRRRSRCSTSSTSISIGASRTNSRTATSRFPSARPRWCGRAAT